MKKGVEYTGEVTSLKFPNKGYVDCGEDGKAIVKGVLPRQHVRFVVSKKRTGYCQGRLKEIVKQSPLEDVTPACPHFGACGGCAYQTMSYDNQLELKKSMVQKILDDAIKNRKVLDKAIEEYVDDGRDYEFEGIIGSPNQWAYRNKMEFSFGDEFKDGPLSLGMHKKESFHDIVTVDQCQIVHEDYNKILRYILDYCAEKNLPFYHKMRHEGYLRHLLVRRTITTGQIIVGLVTTSEKQYEDILDIEGLKEGLLALDLEADIKGIVHIINDGVADIVRSDETRVVFGDEYIYEEILGLKFKISVFSFFQTNSLGAEVLYEKAREYIGDTKDQVVFDLYSGTGTIAQMVAPVAQKVIGVEIIEEAVEAAKVNADLNNLDNCEFIAGDVLKVIDDIEAKPDMLILDPPRDGINPKALEKIIAYGVDRIVYISCKPTSLARDLAVFQDKGYKVEKACAVDMFPNTVHVETVVLLSKGNISTKKVKVDFSLEKLDTSGLSSKATYQEIKEYVLDKFNLKVSSLNIAQIKDKCGIKERENYNIAKSKSGTIKRCTQEKEKAIMDAFRYFAMI